MTEIRVSKKYGAYLVEIEGHAAYADPGRDIVCAGISTLAFTLIRALKDQKVRVDVQVMDPSAGRMVFSFPAGKKTEPVLSAIMSGFQMMREEYPKNLWVGWAK